MSKKLQLSGSAHRRLKRNREENLKKHAEFTDVYVKKAGKTESCFSNDSTRFLTIAYDRYIKLWDTETGIK